MPQSIQNDSENKRILKSEIYSAFVQWSAFPRREIDGVFIEDQNHFAKHFGVSKDTLSLWKKRPEYGMLVDKKHRDWAFDKDPDIYYSIYKNAIKGNASSQRLWMKLFHGFGQKKETLPELSVNDIRFMINVLPEKLHNKYYTFLRQLLDASAAHMNDPEAFEASLKKADYELPPEDETWFR